MTQHGLDENFTIAARDVTKLAIMPTNQEKLILYANYKQAIYGDATGNRPSIFSPEARAKWDGWQQLCGTSQNQAKANYIAMYNSLVVKYGHQ